MQKLKSSFIYIAFLLAGIGLGFVAMKAPAYFKKTSTEGNFEAYYAGAPTKVVMYGTQSCPYCAKTREYFKENKVQFVERDIQHDAAAARQFQELGGSAVPRVLIGDRSIRGYSRSGFDDALARLAKAK